jgi:hypothetical protein
MKQSAIDRAVAQLEGEIKVLQLAVDKLRQQQAGAKTRKPRLVKPPREAPQSRNPGA